MQLFRESKERDIALLGLDWTQHADRMVGSTPYQTTLTSRADGTTHISRGMMRFEIVSDAGKPTIVGFYHRKRHSSP